MSAFRALRTARAGRLEPQARLNAVGQDMANDLDALKAILDLQLQKSTYESALAVTDKLLPPSLIDFLE